MSGFVNREEKQRGKIARPEEKVVWRKMENNRKLDEQRKRLQKELRDVEKLSFIPWEIQRGLEEGMQQQLQDIEQKRHALLPEHQKVQKRSQKIQSTQDKRRNLQKETCCRTKEMSKLNHDVKQKEERILFCRTKSRK